ncbi:MAG: RNA polymerase sigma factor FliA, partial [Sandaracinaceae bacterium]|nr:RNA polymerase sigma factor FliA [Sandaracinaceae bacterium]
IGEKMGISESRVCQLQKRAVHHLRRALIESVPGEEEAA